MLNTSERDRERERKKRERERERERKLGSVFLINFFVHSKISEFIWEVKSSAP